MTLDRAIRRIIWRFKSDYPIKINTDDKLALNKVIEYFNKKQEKSFVDNIHFAKLYVFSLSHFLNKFDTTIDNEIPHRELHNLLRLPFNYFISEMTDSMNQRIRYAILENAGCKLDKHPGMISKDESKNNVDKLIEILKIKKNHQYFTTGAWSKEEVENGIKHQLKNLINDL